MKKIIFSGVILLLITTIILLVLFCICKKSDNERKEISAFPSKAAKLAMAVARNDSNSVKKYIKNGASLTWKNKGWPPVVCAQQLRYFEMLEILLQAGADPDQRDNDSNTALLFESSLEEGKVEVVEKLLDFGAEIDARDTDGRTALMNASHTGNVAIVKALLLHKADVNAMDSNGETPLFYASLNGNVPLMDILLKNGADPQKKTKFGNLAAIVQAALSDNPDAVRLLLNYEMDAKSIRSAIKSVENSNTAENRETILNLLRTAVNK